MRVSFYFGIAFVGLFASEGRDSYYGLPKDGRKKAGGGGKRHIGTAMISIISSGRFL